MLGSKRHIVSILQNNRGQGPEPDYAAMFDQCANHVHSAVREHLPRLARLGKDKRVVEFGFGHGMTSIAFLHGGCASLVSYDIEHRQEIGSVLGPRFRCILQNSLEAEPLDCDILFIDSHHVAVQLQAELDRHAHLVTENIAMHDTHSPKWPEMMPALKEWLSRHPEWRIAEDYENSHGLTILRRA